MSGSNERAEGVLNVIDPPALRQCVEAVVVSMDLERETRCNYLNRHTDTFIRKKNLSTSVRIGL